MKGLALETIAYFIITLVTIMFILTLIGTKLSPVIQSKYCSFVGGLRGVLPLPSYMRPPLPSYCKPDEYTFETATIDSPKSSFVSTQIAAYSIACWERTGKLNVGQNTNCYEIVLTNNLDNTITQDDVLEIVKNEGYEDILVWKADSISKKGSIAITYNSTIKKIEVS